MPYMHTHKASKSIPWTPNVFVFTFRILTMNHVSIPQYPKFRYLTYHKCHGILSIYMYFYIYTDYILYIYIYIHMGYHHRYSCIHMYGLWHPQTRIAVSCKRWIWHTWVILSIHGLATSYLKIVQNKNMWYIIQY